MLELPAWFVPALGVLLLACLLGAVWRGTRK